jgi:hypothetical protein
VSPTDPLASETALLVSLDAAGHLRYACSATILDPQFALTSGPCVAQSSTWTASFGAYASTGATRKIDLIVQHGTAANDVALVRIAGGVPAGVAAAPSPQRPKRAA